MIKKNRYFSLAMGVLLATSTAFTSFAEGITLYDMSSSDVRNITGHSFASTYDTKVYKGDSIDDWLKSWEKANLIVDCYTTSGAVEKEIPITREMIKGFDSSTVGKKSYTIEYAGKTYTGASEGLHYEVVDKAESLTLNRIKTEYTIDDAYDRDDWIVTGNFADGDSTTMKVPESKLIGFNTSTIGTKQVTLRAFGITDSVSINVKQDDGIVESLRVDNHKQTYTVGDAFSEEGTVHVTYDDGSQRDIKLTNAIVSGFSTVAAGTNKSATVTYKGRSTTFTYDVEAEMNTPAKSVSKIEVNDDVTTEYRVGDSFDNKGTLKVTYTDDTTENVRLVPSMLGVFNTTQEGTVAINVTYGGKSATYNITVGSAITGDETEATTVQTISVNNDVTRNYYTGDTFDNVGTIAVSYQGGTITNIPITNASIENFDTANAGNCSVTVTYGGKSATYIITITERPADKKISMISVSSDVTKKYNVGDEFDKNGSLIIVYTSGSSETIPLKNATISGFDTSKVGNCTVQVQYADKSTTYIITVSEKTSSGDEGGDDNPPTTKTITLIQTTSDIACVYKLNETVSDTALLGHITAHYSDGTEGKIELRKPMTSGLDTTTIGNHYVTVTYEGKTAGYTIYVYDPANETKIVTLLRPLSNITDSYYVGDAFDGKGGVLVGYSDGSSEDVKLLTSMLTGFDTTTTGPKIVTITYKNMTTNFTILVNNKDNSKAVDRIVAKNDIKTNYVIGDEYVPNGHINVRYTDGTSEDIAITAAMVTEFDTTTAGQKYFVIKFSGKTTTQFYIVTEGSGSGTGTGTGTGVDVSKPIKNIKINDDVTKKYVKDAKFDGKGTITITYNDGTTAVTALKESMLTGFKTTQFGSYIVKVTYLTASTQYTIFVDRTLTSGSGSGGTSSTGGSTATKRPTHQNDQTRVYSTTSKSSGSSSSSSSSSSSKKTTTTTQKSQGFNSKGRPKSVPNTGGKWSKDSKGNWIYTLKDGKQAKQQWVGNGTDWYYLKADGTLATGWTKVGGYYYWLEPTGANQGACGYGWRLTSTDKRWYFLSPDDGHLCEGWYMVDGKWYYSTKAAESTEKNPTGSMWANTTTPDGYKVDSNGAWIQ